MRKATLPMYCVICTNEIPEDRRLRKAVTCSKEHAVEAKNRRRQLRDEEKCRYCGRPSSTEERRLFAAWRKTLADAPKRGRKPKPKPENTAQQQFTEMITV